MKTSRSSARPLVRFLAIACLGFPAISQGAAVIFAENAFATTWSNPSGATAASASNSTTVDLSESIGFTPGQPIEIRFTPDLGLHWSGSYQTATNGLFAITFSGTVEITVGAYSMTYNEGWGLVQPGSTAGASMTGTNGDGVPHSFIVPWGTDLSEVTVTLTDNSSVSGTNAPRLLTSSMALNGLLVTTSVPEPSTLLLSGLLPVMLLRRRRQMAA